MEDAAVREQTWWRGSWKVGRGATGALLSVVCATALPGAIMAALFFGAGGAAALATGIYAEPLSAATAGFSVCLCSLVMHETAHLVALRVLISDGTAGCVNYSFANVWVAGPGMYGIQNIATAAAGPTLGAACCLMFMLAGTPSWIVLPLTAVHLVNLLPVFPDGRMLLVGLAQLFLSGDNRRSMVPSSRRQP